ncbi:MAG: CcmD family protein [Bacteroidetes bacterium]|nr:MAG: CcmD family protein [Bacteroidota bacterium]
MTIHPLHTLPDSTQAGLSTPYDSVWATAGVPTAEPVGLERVMLAEDKLYVVLAVVLIIWAGVLVFLFRNDRRLARLERRLEQGTPSD